MVILCPHFLYILTIDISSKLFSQDRNTNLLQGLHPPCLPSATAVTNCHYVDDTILFLRIMTNNVYLWDFLRIKFNFNKTELFPINIDDSLTQELVSIFKCDYVNSLLNILRSHYTKPNCSKEIGGSS